MFAARLQAIQKAHLRVLVLHGWSAGPGLPECLLREDQLVSVAEVPASTMKSILCSFWWIFGTVGASMGLVVAANPSMVGGVSWAVSLFSLIGAVILIWICKIMAFRSVIDKDVNLMRAQLLEFEPDVVLGYSWGGAVAIESVFQGYWVGPTLLVNPVCSPLSHGWRNNHISLKNADPECIKIVASRGDVLCGGDDAIRAIARTSVAGPMQAVMFYDDDHMFSRLAGPAVLDWVVSLLEHVYHASHSKMEVKILRQEENTVEQI